MRLEAGFAILLGKTGDNASHSHLAHQLSIGLEQPVRFELGRNDVVEGPAIFLPAGRKHRQIIGSGFVLSLYVDAESRMGGLLADRLGRQVTCLSVRRARAFQALLEKALNGTPLNEATLAKAIGGKLPMPKSGSMTRLDLLLSSLEARQELPSTPRQVAQEWHLSTSRLTHWFSAEVGLPLRAYLRWLRTKRAIAAAIGGADLTTAAHEAGFADAAHFSRTFRRHFGVAPMVALKALTAESFKRLP